MIRKVNFLALLLSFSVNAQDFAGCGEYHLKGVLRHDAHVPHQLMYVVNESTRSQMVFHLLKVEDAEKLSLMINQPSSIKANIIKPMDGTKGVISLPWEIEGRFPNPLAAKDTGIKKIKSINCN